MTHTARVSVVAQRWKALFEQDIKGNEAYGIEVDDAVTPVQDIFYGDQLKIPRFPAICIETGTKLRTWPPLPSLRSENTLEVTFFCYWAYLTGSEELKLKTDQLGEAVEEYMNINHLTLNDASGVPLVIHGHVVENEPGYAVRNNNTNQIHASRLLWRAITKTQLTVAG
jgi:hypothetical protein